MNAYNARDFADHFSVGETIDTSRYVDDCACGCRQHYTVEHGLIHAHGRPLFDRLLVLGDLGLRGNVDLLRLPNELVVTGSLYLSECINLKVLPSQLTVGGNVDLRETRIRELPASMVVQGHVFLDNCPDLIEIGAGVQASGIHASHCKNLKHVAPGLELSYLDLSEAPIKSLPSDLKVQRELNLRNCSSLVEVPEGVTAAHMVDVAGCERLFTLPRSLQPRLVITDGMLFAKNCLIIQKMSEVEASMCLGMKAIHAFPHHHLKNLDGMQASVRSVDHKLRIRDVGQSFAVLDGAGATTRGKEYYEQLRLTLSGRRITSTAKTSTMKHLACN